MAVTVENDQPPYLPNEYLEKVKKFYLTQELSDTVVQGAFTGIVIFFCEFSLLGILLRLLALWTVHKVHLQAPEAISLHIISGLGFILTQPIFSFSMILGIVCWGFSFKILQERLSHELEKSNFDKKMGSFQLNMLIDAFTKWAYLHLEEVFKNARQRLGISETLSGKPLFVMNEIFTTEKTYIRNLQALKQVFQEPMQAILTYDDGFLQQKSIRLIFQNLGEITRLHEKMFSEMKKCATNGQVSGSNIEPFLLGKYSAEMLECYGPYMRSFEKKTEELLQLRKNEKFSNFLVNQLGNPQCQGQPIDALLIRPIQRIPSLLLLYKDFLKTLQNAESTHAKEIFLVVQELNSVLDKLNHEKGIDEGRQKLLELATSVDNFPQTLVSSDRILIDSAIVQVELDGTIGEYKVSGGKSRLNLYLMNDLVLFTRQKQKASGLMGRNKREIELFIGMIYLRDVLELFKIKEENQFGLKYSENESCQYLIVSFMTNEESFIENLIKSGQKINRIFKSVHNYDLGEKVFKNTVQLRRRSKSTDRFRSGIRNSINIEL